MAAVGWSLWKIRNDLVFSNIAIKSPKQVAYKALGFLKSGLQSFGFLKEVEHFGEERRSPEGSVAGGDVAMVIYV